MIGRILVPTDGSPASSRAVGLAARLALKHDASLDLLNVIRDPIVGGTRGLGSVKGMLMGSVSRKVANTCIVILLVVR